MHGRIADMAGHEPFHADPAPPLRPLTAADVAKMNCGMARFELDLDTGTAYLFNTAGELVQESQFGPLSPEEPR